MGALRKETYDCMLLNNYFWGIWALVMLKSEDYGKTDVFNFDFAEARIYMYEFARDNYKP